MAHSGSGSHSSPGNHHDAEKRRSTRLTVEVPITVMGTDPLGEPFRETALTTAISCYGCNYRAHRYSEKNSALTLEIKRLQPPYTPRVVHARVVWCKSRVVEADPWQIRALPDPAMFHAALAGIMADIEGDMRNMLDELAKTTAEALIADEMELIRQNFGGKFEGAIGETHRVFADLKAEIIQETHRICAEIAKEMEDDLRRVIAEHSGLAKPGSMKTIAAKSPRKVRKPKKRTAT